MMMMFRTGAALLLLLASSSVHAWTTTPTMSSTSGMMSRRNVIGGAAASAFVLASSPAVAIDACPPKSQNCVRATWTPPSGTSKKDATKIVRDVLSAYPQEGQEGNVDGGGWVIADDKLDSSGDARVEYKSSGKGNFAKFFNAGKPFVDDLLIEVNDNGTVELRSSSRVGESDFGVNSKRVQYLSKTIAAKGWSV